MEDKAKNFTLTWFSELGVWESNFQCEKEFREFRRKKIEEGKAIMNAKEASDKARQGRAANMNGAIIEMNQAILKAVREGRTHANYSPSGYLGDGEVRKIRDMLLDRGYTVKCCDTPGAFFLEILWSE